MGVLHLIDSIFREDYCRPACSLKIRAQQRLTGIRTAVAATSWGITEIARVGVSWATSVEAPATCFRLGTNRWAGSERSAVLTGLFDFTPDFHFYLTETATY